jgi:hypothetical protein
MSDGPHRSLPLLKHWKKLAALAAKPAYSLGDVAEAFPLALQKDFSKKLLSIIHDILCAGNLFNEHYKDLLEAARSKYRGSVADNLLIDCAIEAHTAGLTGESAFRMALENALPAHALGICRQIEEHYLRKQPWSTAGIRDRLKNARDLCSHVTIASEMISDKPAKSSGYRLPKRTGIDEGPPL